MVALRLSPTYLSAWTLMGHEFLEMKNASAAVQAYRRAVDISESEYRAWYGLGQTYELLHMPLYALHYFRKAASIRYIALSLCGCVSSPVAHMMRVCGAQWRAATRQ